jgi:hypothetical protein
MGTERIRLATRNIERVINAYGTWNHGAYPDYPHRCDISECKPETFVLGQLLGWPHDLLLQALKEILEAREQRT